MVQGSHSTRPAPERCRSCGALVYFCVTQATGSVMPVDVDPVPDGNLVLRLAMRHQTVGKPGKSAAVAPGVAIVESFDETRHEGRNRYVSHFASCKQAKDWRGKGKAR